jgi:hypothetical protein
MIFNLFSLRIPVALKVADLNSDCELYEGYMYQEVWTFLLVSFSLLSTNIRRERKATWLMWAK